MSNYDDTTRIANVTCIAESFKEVLVAGGDLKKETWVPKSAIHETSSVHGVKDEGDLVVRTSWARQNGL